MARSGKPIANKDCTLCHQNVHGEVFEGLETGVQNCADCHSLVSFRSGLKDFDHKVATRFALDGKHAELDCTACHANDPSSPRGRAPAKGPDCASCHAEPHAGQFEASSRGNDCSRCHAPTDSFTASSFNHNTGSNFALEGRHSEIACTDCHLLEEQAGLEIRRYRPLETDCAACHGVAEGGRLRREGRAKGGSEDL